MIRARNKNSPLPLLPSSGIINCHRRDTAVTTSVADQLREESRRRVLAMSSAQGMELALRLGDEDARLYAAANAVSDAEARLVLARRRQAGRQPSKSAEW